MRMADRSDLHCPDAKGIDREIIDLGRAVRGLTPSRLEYATLTAGDASPRDCPLVTSAQLG